jgi:hypothetical protein
MGSREFNWAGQAQNPVLEPEGRIAKKGERAQPRGTLL